MFTITGACGFADVHAETLDEKCVGQIRRMLDMPFSEGAHVQIMPDAHYGAGCTIGTTMRVADKAVPNLVGVDIGCGMLTVDLGEDAPDLAEVDRACHEVPSGFGTWNSAMEPFDLDQLACAPALKNAGRVRRSLGTLGGGNHFIEVELGGDGHRRLIVHSGSRSLGTQVASHYQDLAVQLHDGSLARVAERQELIEDLKAAGREAQIQHALEEFDAREAEERRVPADLAWLYGSQLEDYLHDIRICQDFARRNRELIAREVIARAGLKAADAFHTVHNYIDVDEGVLRKGAIAAHEGELVLIPLNMASGSILAVGLGNDAWNQSAPHGAGRAMSRTRARQSIDLRDYEASMTGVYTTSVSAATVDEAPQAYKDPADILSQIGDTVEVLDIMRPVFNFKAG